MKGINILYLSIVAFLWMLLSCRHTVTPPYTITINSKSATINGHAVTIARHPALKPVNLYTRILRNDLYRVLLISKPGSLLIKTSPETRVQDLQAVQRDLIFAGIEKYQLMIDDRFTGEFYVPSGTEKIIRIEGGHVEKVDCGKNDEVFIHILFNKDMDAILDALKSSNGCKVYIEWYMTF